MPIENLDLDFLDTPQKIDLSWQKDANYQVVDTEEKFTEFLAELEQQSVIVLDLETTERLFKTEKIVGVSISFRPQQACYIPINHLKGNCLSQNFVLSRLNLALKNKKVIMHNAKFDMEFLKYHGDIDIEDYEDTMIMAHFLDTDQDIGLKGLVKRYLKIDMMELKMVLGGFSSFAEVPIEEGYKYACSDSDCTFRLYHFMVRQMDPYKFLYSVELKVLKVLMAMEMRGMHVDRGYFEKQNTLIYRKIEEVKSKLWKEMGVSPDSINLNSSKQMAEILYDKLKIPVIETTSTGKPSVSEKAIALLGKDYPVVKLLSDYKQLIKMKTTFIDGILERSLDGVIYYGIMQSHVKSGRMASSRINEKYGMNIQQISKGDTQGISIRRGFVPRKGYRFLSVDFNQIELRVYASMARIPSLLKSFANNEDIHAATAAKMMGLPLDKVTDDQRKIGKTMNFALLYGGGAGSVSSMLKISREEAQGLIVQYFKAMPEAKKHMYKMKDDAKRCGFIKTFFGRKIKISDINSVDEKKRKAAERGSINLPIQGTAADIFKIALARVFKELRPYKGRLFFIAPIHDEIIFEVDKDLNLEEIIPPIKRAMEFTIASQFAPIKVEFAIGDSWGDMVKYGKNEKLLQKFERLEPKMGAFTYPAVLIENDNFSASKIDSLKHILKVSSDYGDRDQAKIYLKIKGEVHELPDIYKVAMDSEVIKILKASMGDDSSITLFNSSGDEVKNYVFTGGVS